MTGKGGVRRVGDLVFAGLAKVSGLSILVTLALVAAFLIVQATPAFYADDLYAAPDGFWAYVAPYVFAR